MSDPRTSDPVATPKTDGAAVWGHDVYGNRYYVPVDFARDQERRIAELEKVCSDIADFISGHDGNVFDDIAIALLGTKP